MMQIQPSSHTHQLPFSLSKDQGDTLFKYIESGRSDVSLREFFGCRTISYIRWEDSPEIFMALCILYQNRVDGRSLRNTSDLLYERVILPALFNRNICLRRSIPQDKASKDFHILDSLVFKKVEKKFGIHYDKLCEELSFGMVLEAQSQLCGVIHYYVGKEDPTVCHISTIQIKQGFKKLKFGTLLLACAIYDALQNGCKTIKLTSSKEGVPFYMSLGFIPDRLLNERLEPWQKLKFLQACEQYTGRDFEENFTYDLKDHTYLEAIHSAMQQVFDKTLCKMDVKEDLQ